MSDGPKTNFLEAIQSGYCETNDIITVGCALRHSSVHSHLPINIPLKTLNRHGLIAGATGTGKTKTLQIMSELLSQQGVPSLLMDIKGDLSGLAAKGEKSEGVMERQDKLGIEYTPMPFPVEILTLANQDGTPLHATISEFGPLLFSKMLGLNDTQSGVVSLVFRYCDTKKLPLLDIKDFRQALNYLTTDGKQELAKDYGFIPMSTANAILRKLMELEAQGAEQFFCEPSFDIHDLLRKDSEGKGVISLMELKTLQRKPKLYSSFMLCLLAEVYSQLPEIGDPDKPKLVLFIDEAHLIFDQATNELLSQLEMMVKLIRSKGVGIFFCTQSPKDIPSSVLSQLGLKIQHALRAFTALDRKNIKLIAENYPITEFYNTETALTELGIGEALITALDKKGRPTPLVATMLQAPKSRMGPLTSDELQNLINNSPIREKYSHIVDRDSAYELLNRKIEKISHQAEQIEVNPTEKTKKSKKTQKSETSVLAQLSKNPLMRQVGRTLAREITRGLLGVLGLGGTRGSGRRNLTK